jgi:hypothetical protein
MENAKTYFRDFWSSIRGRPVVVHALPSRISWGGPSLKGRARTGPGPSFTLEQRVALLETNYVGLDDRVSEVDQKLDTKHGEALAQISAERAQRQKETAEHKALLENVTVGSLDKEFIGWLWLIGSTVLAVLAVTSQ